MSTFVPALIFMAIIYGNFWWFREQLCIIICPYGRLQSVLQDKDTINIVYDNVRGEPRGKAKKKVEFPILNAEVSAQSQGDCIDCGRCIAVCPTGIDIRNGHQLECIGCAYCIDACDEMMVKVERPRGLIRYDSLRGVEEKTHRFFRPRVFFYGFMGAIGFTVASFVMVNNDAFEANLLRAKATPFVLENDGVKNGASLHVINKSAESAVFKVTPSVGSERFIELPVTELEVNPFEGRDLPLVVRVPRSDYKAGMKVGLDVHASYTDEVKHVEVKVLGPPRLAPPTPETVPVTPGAKP